MSSVLGISAHYHDSAAALVVNGEIVCAIQEERLSRVKNDSSLPISAARACLKFAGLVASDLDRVVFYENPFLKLERLMSQMLVNFPRAVFQFPRAMKAQLGTKLWIRDLLSEQLSIPRNKIDFVEHHYSHAASAFYASPFEEAAIVVADGVGENVTTSIWSGSGTNLRCLDSIEFPHSLGLLYAGLTSFLGFEVNEGEYKVMGLAAFGRDRFQTEFQELIKLNSDGSFYLEPSYFGYMSDPDKGFGSRMERLLGPSRDKRLPWDLSSKRDQRYADIACSLQRTLERAMLCLCKRALARTNSSHLCLAGGVALNAVANYGLSIELGIPIFVQPAAGDAGGALGAALLGALSNGDSRKPMPDAYLGLPIDVDNILAMSRILSLKITSLRDPAVYVAERIGRGEIIGYVSGRFEWGPRALGNRSILADPRKKETKDRLNHIVKKREDFRPFAPVVLSNKMAEWFEGTQNHMTPYMTTIAPVIPSRRASLCAVTHVDGTARVQTINGKHPVSAILTQLEKGGLPPIVLNTSMNGAGQPIAASAQDALSFLEEHPIDALVIEDILIERGGE